ncbi:MAG: ribosome hibernation-promoting factor, HPF/YfiA family [Alphaproteobacteria bacterium]
MQIRVSGKQIAIGETLPELVRERLSAAVEKHFDGRAIGHVVFAPEGSGYRADCTLHLSAGAVLKSHAAAAEPRLAFDAVLDHLEKQVRRYKRKLKNHHARARAPKPPARRQ